MSQIVKASCHCGAVKFEVPSAPEEVVRCNCSICSRIGGRWAYYHPSEVSLKTSRESLDIYVWGDKLIQICRCKTCGCTTHWESIDPEYTERMGTNARMMTDLDLSKIPVKYVDGASF